MTNLPKLSLVSSTGEIAANDVVEPEERTPEQECAECQLELLFAVAEEIKEEGHKRTLMVVSLDTEGVLGMGGISTLDASMYETKGLLLAASDALSGEYI